MCIPNVRLKKLMLGVFFSMAKYNPGFKEQFVNEYLKRGTPMEPKKQIEIRIIQELSAKFKLIDILKVKNFPKSTYHY